MISKKLVATIMAGMCLFSAVACKEASNDPGTGSAGSVTGDETGGVNAGDVTAVPLSKEYTVATSNFAFELAKYSTLDKARNGENVLISPSSVLLAMGMTANGAAGETRKEFEDILFSGISVDEYNKYSYSFIDKTKNVKDIKFNIANSIWINNRVEAMTKENFLALDKTYYDAAVYKKVFDENLLAEVNGWVNDKTDKMIPQIISEVDPDDAMYLINAIAFDAEWETKYEDSDVWEEWHFIDFDGNEDICTRLGSTENTYLENDYCYGVVKPYKGGEYSFVALLPEDEFTTADALLEKLSGDDWISLYENRNDECEVHTSIPEFTYDYSDSLVDDMKAMGFEKAFTESADFSEMFDDHDVLISEIIHKTHIELDRKGTKAAAVTAVVMKDNAIEIDDSVKYVTLNRPFVYFIVDTETGIPVFIGVLNSID